jgi:hypothetical protein
MGNCASCDCDGNGDKKVEFTIARVGNNGLTNFSNSRMVWQAITAMPTKATIIKRMRRSKQRPDLIMFVVGSAQPSRSRAAPPPMVRQALPGTGTPT